MRSALVLVLVLVRSAFADNGVDVHVADDQIAARRISIDWNPLPAITGLGKLSFDLVIVPIDHHALVVNPFYTTASTAPIVVFDDAGNPMRLPEQTFSGVGLEVGYRYYRGRGGPRGVFVGPSLVAAWMHEKQGRFGDGSSTSFVDYGVAVDVGYAALIGGFAIALGGGVQYLATSEAIPQQQWPVRIYANSGVLPRLLLSIGWAF